MEDLLERSGAFRARLESVPVPIIEKLSCLRSTAVLFDHQRAGVAFLLRLWELGSGGVLADEMGLGKTLQTLAFVCHLKERGALTSPVLVVAPLTLVDNWGAELSRFTTLHFVLYKGSAAERAELRASIGAHVDVVVTSYEFALKQELGTQFAYLVVDEGHRLKNSASALHQALLEIHAPRSLLTGTPVQNNLLELCSLLSFVNPQVFGGGTVDSVVDALRHVDWRAAAFRETDTDATVGLLHDAMRPFLLRRRKEDTDVAIPPKVEVVLVRLAILTSVVAKTRACARSMWT